MLQIRSKALQAGQRIPDGRCQRGLGGDLRQLRLQPALQIVEARPGLGCGATINLRLVSPRLSPYTWPRESRRAGRAAARGPPPRWRRARRSVPAPRPRSPSPGRHGHRRTPEQARGRPAPDMRQAGDLADRTGAGELAEPGIAVAVHPAAEARQMALRMRRLAVDREAVPHRWRRFALPGPLVPHIGPGPPSRRLSPVLPPGPPPGPPQPGSTSRRQSSLSTVQAP